MKGKRKTMKDSSAVSPVIGVMLMIVVTIILAAAVASFANDFEPEKDPTNAVFDVKCSASDGLLTIKHMGGDVIYKEDIKIIISHGLPRMTSQLSNDNLTFYPADQTARDPAMDKTSLTAGQVATYSFSDTTYPDATSMAKGNLGGQVIMVGETFEFEIVDVATDNTIFTTNVVMDP